MIQALFHGAPSRENTPALAWLNGLIDATTPDEVGGIIVELAEAQAGCHRASVLWMASDSCLHSIPPTAPGSDQQAQALAALASADGLHQSPADGGHLAFCLLRQERVVLL